MLAREKLGSKKVAILATDGFEQSELVAPREALLEAGATVHVVSLKSGSIKGWNEKDWGESIDVDATLEEADPGDYDALVLPGGVMNPDTLRMKDEAVTFVRTFFESGKPISAICHGPWLLINAGVAKGRKLTSYPSLRADLENAGAEWVDQEVVVDQGLTTSRNPKDLPAFIRKTIEEITEGRHTARATA